MQIKKLQKARLRRKYHTRKSVFGTRERPRLSVFRSHRHIYAQIIDDAAGLTLAAASTRGKNLRNEIKNCGNKAAAQLVGAAIAKQALQVGIKCVRFDRGRYQFHGRMKSLADAARQTGLVF
jgi:large subunit ribosomal protein L18